MDDDVILVSTFFSHTFNITCRSILIYWKILILLLLIAVCEHAYSLAQNLDPNSEGRGVLQFKTGLMSVIKVYILANIY